MVRYETHLDYIGCPGCGPEGSLLALEAGFFQIVPPATIKQE